LRQSGNKYTVKHEEKCRYVVAKVLNWGQNP